MFFSGVIEKGGEFWGSTLRTLIMGDFIIFYKITAPLRPFSGICHKNVNVYANFVKYIYDDVGIFWAVKFCFSSR